MTRRGNIKRIDVLPDPVYNSVVLSKSSTRLCWTEKKARQKKLFMAL